MNQVKSIRKIFPEKYHSILQQLEKFYERLQEIRIRVNAPVSFRVCGKEVYPDWTGFLHNRAEEGIILNKSQVGEIFNHICDYSPYAFDEQLKNGFITVEGGHRIGTFGQAVVSDGKITMMKQIYFLHIRIAHEVMGAAEEIYPYLFEQHRLCNTLIFSLPGVGKTTLLRDVARRISEGGRESRGLQVCMIDERSELAGNCLGIPQNHVGIRTDVLEGCPKAAGMQMAIRSMGPEVLVIDELGAKEDYEAVIDSVNAGINLVATIHGDDLSQVINRQFFYPLWDKRVFQRFIQLKRGQNQCPFYIMLDQDGKELKRGMVP